jgi:Flp pilus assembly protein TadD
MVAGRSEEGLTHLRRALQLMPDMAWVKTNLLDAMVALGHCDETISGLRRDALADCNNRVGILHSQAQRFAEASRHFGRAAELVPTTGMYHANLAAALLQMGDRQSAVLHAEEARKLGVRDHWVFGALSRP